MNRAERRRQNKIEKRANKADCPAPPSQPVAQQTLTIQQAVDLAVQHHTAGRLSEAEKIYQQILHADPNHPVALHLLGVIAHQVGKNDMAVDLIQKAIAIKPDYAKAYSNLGLAYHELGKPDESMASYQRAIAIQPDFAEAYSNLGNILNEQNDTEQALVCFQKALTLKPNFAEAHNNLGNMLRNLGKADDALAAYRKALAINPNYAETHNNLGSALMDQGKLDEALASYQRALTLQPDNADTYNNLGIAYHKLGQYNKSFNHAREAISRNPNVSGFWSTMASSLRYLLFSSIDQRLMVDLLSLLNHNCVRPPHIAQPILSALHHLPELVKAIQSVRSTQLNDNDDYRAIAEQMASIPLFLKLIKLTALRDLELEEALTSLRRSLIQTVSRNGGIEKGAGFSQALALHCFANEYLFLETDEEKALLNDLQNRVSQLIDEKRSVPADHLIALGCYRPLHSYPWAEQAAVLSENESIRELIERQITEPLKERSLQAEIDQLTPIEGAVSQRVRQQYEENPYPRWTKTQLVDDSKDILHVLQLAEIDVEGYTPPPRPQFLIAGCGTGQHALYTATRFKSADVLAVDLSLSSLAYAMRKTEEHGITNISYAQADIMALASLDRTFDVIESSGVLHHLEDPLAGWKVLLGLLNPGGLMKIGLYSETARQDIVAGRQYIGEKGYTAHPDNIRRFRQDIISRVKDGDTGVSTLLQYNDFYSLSECRDLLFHVQEHRFTLPEIELALDTLNLKFMGFEISKINTVRQFKARHPDKSSLNNLKLWHAFEMDNPKSFRNMYQFWCRKL